MKIIKDQVIHNHPGKYPETTPGNVMYLFSSYVFVQIPRFTH